MHLTRPPPTVVMYDMYACVRTSARAMAHAWADTAIMYMRIVGMGICVSPSISRDCTRIVLNMLTFYH